MSNTQYHKWISLLSTQLWASTVSVIASTKSLFHVLFYYILRYMLVIRSWSSTDTPQTVAMCSSSLTGHISWHTQRQTIVVQSSCCRRFKARHFVPKTNWNRCTYAFGSTTQRDIRYLAAAGKASATMPVQQTSAVVAWESCLSHEGGSKGSLGDRTALCLCCTLRGTRQLSHATTVDVNALRCRDLAEGSLAKSFTVWKIYLTITSVIMKMVDCTVWEWHSQKQCTLKEALSLFYYLNMLR